MQWQVLFPKLLTPATLRSYYLHEWQPVLSQLHPLGQVIHSPESVSKNIVLILARSQTQAS